MLIRTLVALFVVASLHAQTYSIQWNRSGQFFGEKFGETVALMRDLDGDGLAEVAVGSPQYSNSGLAGSVAVLRGSDGSLLWRALGATGTYFGRGLANVGDADGDGYDDLMVGAPHDLVDNEGAAYLLSGKTGQIVWTRTGASIVPPGIYIQNFGTEVHHVGDINGDGFGDAWVLGGDIVGGFGTVLSGRDGTTLHLFNSNNARKYPYRACALGDRDGDGYDDYAFGSPDDFQFMFPVSSYFGSITMVSGRTGLPFMIVEGEHVVGGTSHVPAFGLYLDSFGDMNGDGVTDLIVGDPNWGDGTNIEVGRAQVVSGADGAILATYGGVNADYRDFGWGVHSVGDLTGDGYGDFAVQGRERIGLWMTWMTQILDGRSGQVVQRLLNDEQINLLWGNLSGGMDLNGDRIPDLINGVPWSPPLWQVPPNDNGLTFAIDLGWSGTRPLAQTRGVGCMTSSGTLPELRVKGLPKLGLEVTLVGRALPPSSSTLLLLGQPQTLDLSPFGAPGCTGYVDPGYWLFGMANAGGRVERAFATPMSPALQGLALTAQWLALDPAANALGMVFTNVADLELQR